MRPALLTLGALRAGWSHLTGALVTCTACGRETVPQRWRPKHCARCHAEASEGGPSTELDHYDDTRKTGT